MSAVASSNLEITQSSPRRSIAHASPLTYLRQGFLLGVDVSGFALAAILAQQGLRTGLSAGDLTHLVVVSLALFCASGLYSVPATSPVTEIRKIVSANALASLSFALLSVASGDRQGLVLRLLCLALAVPLIAVLRPSIRSLLIRSGLWFTPTVIIGSGANADRLLTILKKNKHIGLQPVAVLDNLSPASNRYQPGIIREHVSQASAIARKYGISHAIIADPESDENGLGRFASQFTDCFKHVIFIRDYAAIGSLAASTKDIGGLLGLHISQNLPHRHRRAPKRVLDLLVAGAAATIVLPLFLILYLAVRLSSAGPVFYGQRRIGLHGNYFTAWKFRSMVPNADEILREHLATDPALRQEWELTQKLRNDPRVLPIGKIMRKTSLDEVPQLWNVLCGDMSLVGPRPIVSGEDERYGESFDLYKKVRPGITGMWQISGRSNTSYEERVSCDEYYVKNWSVWLDIYILFRTIKTVLLLEGAC